MIRLLQWFMLAAVYVVSVPIHAQTILSAEPGVRSHDVVAGRLKVRLVAGLPHSEHVRLLQSLGLTAMYPVLPYELSITAHKDRFTLQNINEVLRAEEVLLRSYVVSYNTGEPPEQRMADLSAMCATIVECCSPVYAASLTGIPNDPKVAEQRMLATIHAFEAWDVEGGSDTLLIGISDSGVLTQHEDLDSNIARNTKEIPDNGIDDDNNGYVDDYRGYNFCTSDDNSLPGDTYNPVEGHGTGVAGICGAVANNQLGVAGMAGVCKLWPLKTMPNTTRSIVYGYESLIYCAVNRIPVVNCSWGSTGKSCVDESVVRYVIARGTAVVAAAGNHGLASPFYPGSYPGVLNVGVTNPDDEVIGMSGHGPTVDIMAPGQETVTTSNNGGYGTFCCTSGSSPIVAAVVALVRSHYPSLSPVQACALVRESADPSPWKSVQKNVNPDLLPYGRINALHALTMAPDSLPSVEWDSAVVYPTSGKGRWGIGDTLAITLYGTNVLAEWTVESLQQLHCTPDTVQSVQLVGADSIGGLQQLSSGQSVVIEGLRCVVTRATDTTTYLRANIVGTTKAGDKHRRPISIAIVPQPAFINLSNDVLTVSVGDLARFGNTDVDRGQGAGLVYRNLCGQLYEAGLMVAANNKVVDAVRGVKGVDAHFRPEKRFMEPDSLVAVFTDDNAPDSLKLGVSVECRVSIGSADTASIVLDITVENTSDTVLNDPAFGWFCDWDLGTLAGHNNVYGGIGNVLDGVLVESANGTSPIVWCTTATYRSDAKLIHGALDNTTTYPTFSVNDKYDILHGSANVQSFKNIDVASLTGVAFSEPMLPGQRRSFRQVFVIDTNVNRAKSIASAIVQGTLPEGPLIPDSTGIIGVPFPNPASSVVTIPVNTHNTGNHDVTIFDIQGRTVWSGTIAANRTRQLLTLDLSALPAGIYHLRIMDGHQALTTTLVIMR